MDPLSYILNIQFTSSDTFLIVGIVLLLFASAFFSSSETAFSTANLIRIRNYADENRKGARKALWLMEHYDKTLTTILVGNNFVNIASTTLCAVVFGKFIVDPTIANLLNTVIMTIIVLIFGEIFPKCIAKANAEKLALHFSGVMFVLQKCLTPITFLFYKLQKSMLSKNPTINPTVTGDELESIIDTMEEEGVLDSKDADIFQNVIDIDNQDIYEFMTPRIDIVAANKSIQYSQLYDVFMSSGFSRIPIYDEDKDHIIGIIHLKDFIKYDYKSNNIDITKIMSQPLFVAENMKTNDLMRKMQSEKKHMAIVIDEHGGTSGLVTFEDAIEQIMGDIYDEHDEQVVVNYMVQLDECTYEINPDIELEEVFENLNIENVPETEYSSLGGYLYELSENLPEENQVFDVVAVDEQMTSSGEYVTKTVKLKFIITKIEDKSIAQVKLIVTPSEFLDTKKSKSKDKDKDKDKQ